VVKLLHFALSVVSFFEHVLDGIKGFLPRIILVRVLTNVELKKLAYCARKLIRKVLGKIALAD
jgi:hypothetical protein